MYEKEKQKLKEINSYFLLYQQLLTILKSRGRVMVNELIWLFRQEFDH